MRREFVLGTVFAAAMAVGVGAQTGYGTQSRDSRSKNEITVTGCLQSGDESGSTGTSATGTSGSTAGSTAGTTSSMAGMSSASGVKFRLTNVSMRSSTSTTGAAAGTTGTTGASAASEFPNGLQLVSSDSKDSDWSKYLNHRVEVKGTLENNSGASPMGSTAGAAASASESSAGSPKPGTLRVSSIRSISDTCSGD